MSYHSTTADNNPVSSAMKSLSAAYKRFLARGYQPGQLVTADNAGEYDRRYQPAAPRTRADINRRRIEALRLWSETPKTALEIAIELDCEKSTINTWVRRAGLSRRQSKRGYSA